MRWLIRSLISILVLIPFLMHLNSEDGFDLLNQFEYWSYDTRMKLTMPGTPDSNIVIIDVDEKSMLEFGQWPWPRDVLADLVSVLFDHYNISVLGFDMQFPEPDRDDDLELLDELETYFNNKDGSLNLDYERLRRERNRDKIFADSIRGRNVVLGFTLIEADLEVGALPEPIINLNQYPEYAGLPFLVLSGHIGNLEILQNTGVGGGNFNPLTIDSDGKIRGIAMLSRKGDMIYESLSMAVARMALGVKTISFANDSYGAEQLTGDNVSSILMGDTEYFVGDEMEMLIPYRGPEGTFIYKSAADVINKKVDSGILDNAIVLVGSRASGLRDLRVAPISENFPGVEMNANMVSGIILNSVKQSPEFSYVIEIFIIFLVAILFTILLPRLQVLYGTILAAFLIAIFTFVNLVLWNNNWVMPISTTVLFTTILFFAHLIYGSFIETRRKNQLTKLFGQYVPPELVDEMETDLSSYSMETLEAELTVMFADIRGFTPLSEAMTAEQVTQLLNEFLTMMTEVIHSKRGTIDKYMGDAIMAFWGAPLPNENHAQDALDAALLMQEKMQLVNENLSARGLPNISICIGLNTGSVRVGNMGSEFRMAYTAIGDAVNLAARLEALTRNYEVGIMIGEDTRRVLKNTVCLELDKVRVKGKDIPVLIYEPLGYVDDMSAQQAAMLEKHQQALAAYREKSGLQPFVIFMSCKKNSLIFIYSNCI